MTGGTGAEDWTVVGRAGFVQLTTFRRSGEGVATPVWIAPDGDALVVTTERATGKVKRLRNDPRVRLRPCTRFGKVADDAVTVDAVAEVIGAGGDQASPDRALRRKYRLQYVLILGVERFMRRRQGRPGDRVILRITRP